MVEGDGTGVPTQGTVRIDDTVQSISHTPIQYHIATGHDDISDRVKQLEKDLDFISGMLVELYNKCPKTKRTKAGDKNTSIECENCGGVLW